MNPLNCIIVDDEPLSQDVLITYIKEVSGLKLIASCFNALEAIEILRQSAVDLIFLDINMPKVSGINFLKSLDNPPLVIFTTAYPQYAVEGFELDVTDYLLKPISFERFLKGVNKVFDIYNRESPNSTSANKGFMAIKSDKKTFKVNYSDIQYFQAYGDFVKVFLDNKILITSGTLKSLEKSLPSEFIRVHKSYILSIDRIKYIEGNIAHLENSQIPLSPDMKEVLFKRLNPDNNQDGK